MTDHPISEPAAGDPRLDRTDDAEQPAGEEARTRPSAPEGEETGGGIRPPRPSQAEGERDGTEEYLGGR